ncbi:MAG: hypothetical protein K940chlam2_00284 [Chlamydiae bacterium]|nr:hypothetical protein [Chlamydiota bacterium]
MKKKRAFTLLEIMIVIFLIGLISSVVGYNMKGSLDEGKSFKTERAKEQLEDLLNLQIAQGHSEDEVIDKPAAYLKNAGYSKPDNLIKDGWGEPFKISLVYGEVRASSAKWENYKAKKKRRGLKKSSYEEDDEDKES